MNLLEHEAKKILGATNIPIPPATLLKKDQEYTGPLPVVLKSQVPTGGRGKLGGIRPVNDTSYLKEQISELFNLSIKGYRPTTLLAEAMLEIKRELYLAILINRQTSTIELVAHRQGGIEVESNDTADFLHIELTGNNNEAAGEQLAEYYGLESQNFALQEMVINLHHCFVKNDITLIEINPLILTANNRLVAGDCKMTIDDAAGFRHNKWRFEEKSPEVNFVTLDETGNIATIANGAGLAMATVDAVSDHGLTPANFLDIGGGASTASVLAAFERILKYPNISAIVINIFAGITRCDEIAKAIIAARQQIDTLPSLYIRLAGTNYEAAVELLKKENIPLFNSLEDSLEAVLQEKTL